MLVLIAGYSAHILFIYHDIIEEERSGLLIKDLKSGGDYWLYFPMFLLRRTVYIFVPLLIKRLDYQLFTLFAQNIAVIIIYGNYQPHVFKERTKIELMNESFIIMFLYHLICYTDFN